MLKHVSIKSPYFVSTLYWVYPLWKTLFYSFCIFHYNRIIFRIFVFILLLVLCIFTRLLFCILISLILLILIFFIFDFLFILSILVNKLTNITINICIFRSKFFSQCARAETIKNFNGKLITMILSKLLKRMNLFCFSQNCIN